MISKSALSTREARYPMHRMTEGCTPVCVPHTSSSYQPSAPGCLLSPEGRRKPRSQGSLTLQSHSCLSFDIPSAWNVWPSLSSPDEILRICRSSEKASHLLAIHSPFVPKPLSPHYSFVDLSYHINRVVYLPNAGVKNQDT